MSMALRTTASNKSELVITDEPSYIQPLEMAPESREPELDCGTWLVVAFPVWSSPVRQSVYAAVACAKDHGGKFQLGIRPFDSYEEFKKWWPARESPTAAKVLVAVHDEGARREIHISTDPSSNPIWLVLKDGLVLHQGGGPRSKEQLNQLMELSRQA
jgi:hypothetical protein